MDEIREVEEELKRLRDEATHFKHKSAATEKENTTLKARNDYLLNKLKEASYVYGEAGKRLLYFINNQVNPVVERLNRLEAADKKMKGQDKAIGESVIEAEKEFKLETSKLAKSISDLTSNVALVNDRLQTAIKSASRKSEEADAALAEKLDAAAASLDRRMNAFRTALDKRITAKLALLEKSIDGKMDILREKSLILSKDVESLSRFGADIEGLDGRLNETISHLTQTRMEMEKLDQKVKNSLEVTRSGIKADMESLSRDVDGRIASAVSDMEKSGEKSIGELDARMAGEKLQLAKKLKSFESSMASFESSLKSDARDDNAAMRKEIKSFADNFDGKIGMVNSIAEGNAKTQKEFERAVSEKLSSLEGALSGTSSDVKNLLGLRKSLSDLIRKASTMEQKMETAEQKAVENLEDFKARFDRHRVKLKSELANIQKAIDQKVKQASSALEKQSSDIISGTREEFMSGLGGVQERMSMLEKDISRVPKLESNLVKVAAEVGKRKEELAALEARTNSVLKDVTDKSEKADIMLKKHLEVMQSEIKSSIEKAETRMARENVRTLSAARNSMKNDMQGIKEDNAALKAEVKNLQALASVVGKLQRDVVVSSKAIAEFGNTVDQMSAEVSSRLENETLKASKEMSGMAAGLKSELGSMISRERERFAAQSADMLAKYDSIAGQLGDVSSGSSKNAQESASNRKRITELERNMKKMLRDIAGLKNEYKVQMGRLLKEIEG